MHKIAVIFPGIGYHTDKPLLYYSKKMAAAEGFEIVEVSYGGFPSGIKGNPEKMQQAFELALEQAEELLKDVDFAQYDSILFISKSIGTAVAAAYGTRHCLKSHNVAYTPVPQTFALMDQPGILFHGTKDPWMPHEIFMEECRRTGYPCYLTEGGNHSLETGDVTIDLRNLQVIMDETKKYIGSLALSHALHICE